MHLRNGIEVLVKDWIALHEEGGTELSINEILDRLDKKIASAITPDTEPAQIAGLVESHLREIPGALESVGIFMAQFESPGELLDEMDLDCFVNDMGTDEDDDF